jgi:hypothetical protein
MHPPRKSNRSIAITTICLISLEIAIGLGFPQPFRAQACQQSPDAKMFNVASDPDFKNYQQVVTRFAKKHRPKAENNFCIIGSSTDNVKNAWVLWREGSQIILWEGGSDLDLSRRIIHLKSDVVPTEGDLHGSTYLVTKSWVDDLSRSCSRLGVKVHTRKVKGSHKQ